MQYKCATICENRRKENKSGARDTVKLSCYKTGEKIKYPFKNKAAISGSLTLLRKLLHDYEGFNRKYGIL